MASRKLLSVPSLLLSSILAFATTSHAAPISDIVSFNGPFTVEAGGMHNVKVTYNAPIDGQLSLHYGHCDLEVPEHAHHQLGSTHISSHPLAKRHADWEGHRPSSFIWLPPADIPNGGCLHALAGEELVGKSEKLSVMERYDRRWTAFADVADAMGPWFDGVEYLKEKEPSEHFVSQTKSKQFGIIGGGTSGLMTAYFLDSVGFHDWKIIEASNRIGGRVHTSYLNGTTPDQYQYQEMGPMRFSVSISYSNETIGIRDHRMVFQLADTLNKMNGNDSELAVNFIPWIQSSANEPADTSKRRPDGTVPGVTEVANNPAYADNDNSTYSNVTAVDEAFAGYEYFMNVDRAELRSLASNVFQAHKKAIQDGWFDWSEAGYMRYVLHTDLNITDEADSSVDFDAS